MEFCIATVVFWHSVGFDTGTWRKNANGTKAIAHREVVEILVPNIETVSQIKTYGSASHSFRELLKSPEWANGRDFSSIPEDYGLFGDLQAHKEEVTTQLAQTQADFHDAVSKVTVDSEVILARTGVTGIVHTTLDERLDGIESIGIAHDLDTDTKATIRLEVKNGLPRLRMEEI